MRVLSDYTDPHELGVELASGAMGLLIAQVRRAGANLCQRCAAVTAYQQAVEAETPAGTGTFWDTVRVARDSFLIDAMRDECECGRVA